MTQNRNAVICLRCGLSPLVLIPIACLISGLLGSGDTWQLGFAPLIIISIVGIVYGIRSRPLGLMAILGIVLNVVVLLLSLLVIASILIFALQGG